MPYIITNSDGTLTVTVSDNTVDTASYSLALVGRSVSNYGQYFAQNTIRHLENFASATAPSTPITGQIWYDKTEKVIRVYDGVYWKRTGIVVGANNTKPTTQLAGGGTAFFNTTNNKLEVHNGTNFREASYGGEVTSAYSTNTDVDSPTFFGTRLRTLFLKGTEISGGDPKPFPVLALVHVKSTTAGGVSGDGIRKGVTAVGEQYETIMALWSDFNFIVATDTQTPVDGQIVNYRAELIEPDYGIAGARPGRIAGEIKPGLNSRAEYESGSVIRADQIYVTQLGGPVADERVITSYFQDVNVYGLLDVANSLNVAQDITANGSITVEGDITASTGIVTCANLVVTANTTLSGITHINGNLVVNGVNTQSLGTDAEKIENAYFDNIDTQNITIDDTVTAANVTFTDTISGPTASFNNLTVTVGPTEITGTTTLNNGLTVSSGATALEGTLTANSTATFNNTTTFNSDITVTGSSNITLGTGFFVGTATKAQYADLAEIYASDTDIGPGTVVVIGGSAEVTACNQDASTEVFGVVSTDPAYLMNSKADGVAVALQGRVPVKIVGTCSKGDRLVSSGVTGFARAIGSTEYDPRIIIGRALAHKTHEGEGTVEAVIGVK